MAPLYQHMFPPACPSLALIGLLWKVGPCSRVCPPRLLAMAAEQLAWFQTELQVLSRRARARQVVPFPQHELQGKWVARVLSDRARLPARAAMDAAVAEHAAQLAARGVPTRHGTGTALPACSCHVGWTPALH